MSDQSGPELADVRRYGRRLVTRFVDQAREADRPQFGTMLTAHLGVPADRLPVAEQQWPAYEHVNVQAALDAWLEEPGREHRLVGVAGYRHRGSMGLADLLGQLPEEAKYGPRPGNVLRTSLPIGPDGQTSECLRVAIVLVSDGDNGDGRSAILFRGPDPEDGREVTTIEVIASREGAGAAIASRLTDLAVEHNVYRGQVVSFGRTMFGRQGSFLRFHRRESLTAGELILPTATFDDVRRQVVGVARHREALRSAGQHLKRGLLLYGPPGVGKTHTVRFLVGELADTTIVQLSGDTLHAIKEACSIARTLQPAMIVVEDVDLIAEERDHYSGSALPLLFTLLNEMDGLDEDADVVFLLTTNRADLLEDALASRPGRVDQAVHIDLPDREARQRLVELYRRGLSLDDSRLGAALDRTDGVTASFLKELLRRAAVVAADREQAAPADGVRVSADDLDAALDDLLDTRNRMTRRALGLEGSPDDSAGDPS